MGTSSDSVNDATQRTASWRECFGRPVLIGKTYRHFFSALRAREIDVWQQPWAVRGIWDKGREVDCALLVGIATQSIAKWLLGQLDLVHR